MGDVRVLALPLRHSTSAPVTMAEAFDRAKKSYALYPGMVRAVSGGFLRDHYVQRRQRRSAPRVLLDIITGAAFQAWIPLRARGVARRFGLGPDWARKASRIARDHYVDPNDLALFRIDSAAELDGYARRYEYGALLKAMNPTIWRGECALTDKRRFYARCAEHGLPHPPVLATIEQGQVTVLAVPAQQALALKTVSGNGGQGFRLIDYPQWEGGDEARFRDFLVQHFSRQRGRWLIQPKIEIDPTLKDLALNALATVRVTTMKAEDGTPEIVTSVLRFASNPASEVDNIAAGGLMAPVDSATGALGEACRGKGPGEFTHHPVSGAQIAGRRLPHWDEVKWLVGRAHAEAFPEHLIIGWDVALSTQGPMLIEGNRKPCMIVAQRANRRGVGTTRFGELLAYHLRAAG